MPSSLRGVGPLLGSPTSSHESGRRRRAQRDCRKSSAAGVSQAADVRACFWRNARLRVPTRMGPASVFPRVSRQSTFGRAGQVQTRWGAHVVPVIGTIETLPMRSRAEAAVERQ